MTSPRDTIVAVATAPGAGGVAVVRVSGNESHAIVARLFRRRGGGGIPEMRRVYVGNLLGADGEEAIDQVLVFGMRAPRTYTGEDVVEVQCHGGTLVTQRILESLCSAGARPAEPGEFTKRAFENGRMDLAQAEAVADLIAARSEAGRRLAWSQLQGSLSAQVGRLRESVIQARSRCEVSLDFSDEDVPEIAARELEQQLARVRGELEVMAETFERGRLRYRGARVALVGRPNVGKSSLLNALLGRERAIVTPIPGTTRDVVEASIVVRGAPVVLMDTAGIRDATDVVEAMGVERSRRAVDDSDCVVIVFDRSSVLTADDALVAEAVAQKPTIAVLNKADLPPAADGEAVAATVHCAYIVEVSALTGAGLRELTMRLADLLFGFVECVRDDEVVIFRARHHDALRKAIADLLRAEDGVRVGTPLELIASDLAAAAVALAGITGEITSEDVLDRVFADFCLGK